MPILLKNVEISLVENLKVGQVSPFQWPPHHFVQMNTPNKTSNGNGAIDVAVE